MEFVVIAYDAKDEGALERRMAAREAHLKNVDATRQLITHGGAILDDAGTMIGSVMIFNCESRAVLDQWLATDPYIVGKVWTDITVLPYKTAPAFTCNLQTASCK